MSRMLTAAGGLIALGLATLFIAAAAPGAGTPTYLDPHASIDRRVHDLLERMTLEEKVGQMDQIVIGKLRDTTSPANGDCNNAGGNNDPLQTTCLQRTLIDYKTGSILSGGTDNPADNTGHGWAEQYNTIQHYAVEHSRLHIPVIYGVDAVHGFGHPTKATLFPQSIGMGATWDTELAQDAGAATRQQLLATGGNWDFAPVQDLARDNRWGRYYETWAEEPQLAAALGAANIQRHPGRRLRLAAGRGDGQALRRLLAIHQRARPGRGAAADPVPAGHLHAGLRRRHRCRRVDSDDRLRLDQQHPGDRLALPDHRGATAPARLQGRRDQRLRRRAGAADDLPRRGGLPRRDREGGQRGDRREHDPVRLRRLEQRPDPGRAERHVVSKQRIDESVERILRLKFQLGLFDHPYVDPTAADAAVEANRALAKKAADESITLLRNQSTRSRSRRPRSSS